MKNPYPFNSKEKWKIVDYKGRTIKKGFSSYFSAFSFLSRVKLNPQEDLRVVKEE